MKLKFILYSLVLSFSILFVACDDDQNGIGNNIQPQPDTIGMDVDSVYLTARTIVLDSVYSITTNGLLGKYEDAAFGSMLSEYLSQMYCPDTVKFHPNITTIDSTRLIIDFGSYYGDSSALMGVSAYEVTKNLEGNYYTNVDPAKYCNLSKKIGQAAYIVGEMPFTYTGSKVRSLSIDLGKAFGQRFFDGVQNGHFINNVEFNKFFKGVYIASDFGAGSIVKVLNTSINVYYTYADPNLQNAAGDGDSLRVGNFALKATEEGIQMNRIKNTLPTQLTAPNTDACYIKSPAGVYTEITIPIKEVMRKLSDKYGTIDTTSLSLNLASFSIRGYTEKESSLGLKLPRVENVLLIERDSLDTFFKRTGDFNSKTQIISSFSIGNNTVYFKNISSVITHYIKYYIEHPAEEIKDVAFLLVPITPVYNSAGSNLLDVIHDMTPRTTILRNNKEDLKLKLIYNRY